MDEMMMRMALRASMTAAEAGEVPIGAVLVDATGTLIGKAHNQVETLKDATAHAEILAISQGNQALGNWRLEGCTLYVTKEACAMCAGAIVFSRISRIVWGVSDPIRGGHPHFGILASEQLNHRLEVVPNILAEECRDILTGFFRAVRANAIDKPGSRDECL